MMYKIVEENPPKLSDHYSKELQTLYERYDLPGVNGFRFIIHHLLIL